MKMRAFFLLLCATVFPQYMATVEKAAGPITVDGTLNEASWQAATPLTPFLFPWGGAYRRTASNVKLLYDDNAFYIGATFYDTSICKTGETTTAPGGEDYVEFHIAPDTLWKSYFYVFETNMDKGTNTHFRHPFPSGRGGWFYQWTNTSGITWNFTQSGTVNNYTDDDSFWTFECSVPFSAIAGWPITADSLPFAWNPAVPPVVGSHWRFNINRMNWDSLNAHYFNVDYDYSIWSHNGSYPYGTSGEGAVHFHDHNNFGMLTFGYTVDVESAATVSEGTVRIEAIPNPFNPLVRVILKDKDAKTLNAPVHVFDASGRLVRELVSGGVWDASAQPSGVYLARVSLHGHTITKHLVLIK